MTLIGLLGVVLALTTAVAQQGPQEVTLTAGDPGAGVAEEVSTGYTEFVLENAGDAGYTVNLFRLKEGTDPQAFEDAIAAVDAAFMSGEGVVEALNAALELGEAYGAVSSEPGGTGRVGVVLEEGTYLLEGFADGADRATATSFDTFRATGPAVAEAPEPDVTVQMVDFAFALPPGIRAGEQTWRVVNSGQQLHHMILFRLNEGATMDDFTAWMESEQGPPPGEEAGYVEVLSPGLANYVTLTLEAGDYVAICFMPDHRGDATGQPHFMLGMMQTFTVDGE